MQKLQKSTVLYRSIRDGVVKWTWKETRVVYKKDDGRCYVSHLGVICGLPATPNADGSFTVDFNVRSISIGRTGR